MSAIGDILINPESGMKRIDNTNAFIKYNGTFSIENDSKHWAGNCHYSNTIGDSIEFKVKNTKKLYYINVYNSNRSNKDHTNIYIDGNFYDSFTSYDTTTKLRALQYIIEFDDEDVNKEHIIKFENIAPDGKYLCLDAIDIDEDGDILPILGTVVANPYNNMNRYSPMNMNIQYDGHFLNDGNVIYTDTLGDKASFYFYGKRLFIINNTHSNRSDAIEVVVDGRTSIISEYGANIHKILVYDSGELEEGIHKVSIVNNSTTKSAVLGLEFIDIQGFLCSPNGKYINVTPVMTSDATPTPYEIIYSSCYDTTNYRGFKAFNSSISDIYDVWATAKNTVTGWIALNFKKPTFVSAISVTSRVFVSDSQLSSPKNFEVYGSNDNGVTYELIKEWKNITGWDNAETKYFNFGRTVCYKMYKYNISDNEGNTLCTCVGELSFLLDADIEKYIIKDGDSLKTINYEDNTLIDATLDNLKGSIFDGKCIINLSDIVPYISQLSDKFSIISTNYNKLNINGYKSYREMVIYEGNYVLSIAENIHNIKPQLATDYDGVIKFIISTDNGVTWNTYNKDTKEFTPVSQEIPTKTYEDLTEQELLVWNAAEEFIFNNGNDIEDLEHIDFNTIENKYFKLAFVIKSQAENLDVFLQRITWQYDGKGYYKQLTNGTDVSILQNEERVSIEALRDIEHLQVIINNGELNASGSISSYKQLRDIPKMDGIPFIGDMSLFELNIATRTQLAAANQKIKELEAKIKQVNNINRYRGPVQTYTEMIAREDVMDGDVFLVIQDENNDGKSFRYSYDEENGFQPIGEFSIKSRDFKTEPIDLSEEVVGELPLSNIENGNKLSAIANLNLDDKQNKIRSKSFIIRESEWLPYDGRSNIFYKLLNHNINSIEVKTEDRWSELNFSAKDGIGEVFIGVEDVTDTTAIIVIMHPQDVTITIKDF